MRRSTTATTLSLCLGAAVLLTACANIKPAASAAEGDHSQTQPAGETAKRASMMDDQMMRMQEMHEKMMAAHLEMQRKFQAAVKPLYAALNDQQKQVADTLIKGMCGM